MVSFDWFAIDTVTYIGLHLRCSASHSGCAPILGSELFGTVLRTSFMNSGRLCVNATTCNPVRRKN